MNVNGGNLQRSIYPKNTSLEPTYCGCVRARSRPDVVGMSAAIAIAIVDLFIVIIGFKVAS